jgi:hypothetical protein
MATMKCINQKCPLRDECDRLLEMDEPPCAQRSGAADNRRAITLSAAIQEYLDGNNLSIQRWRDEWPMAALLLEMASEQLKQMWAIQP